MLGGSHCLHAVRRPRVPTTRVAVDLTRLMQNVSHVTSSVFENFESFNPSGSLPTFSSIPPSLAFALPPPRLAPAR